MEDEEETIENNEEKDRRKEEKVNRSVNCRLDSSSCKSLGASGDHFKRFWSLVINSLQQDCFLSFHRSNSGRKL